MTEHSRKYRTIAQKLIKGHPKLETIRDYKPRIAYAAAQEEKHKGGKTIFGQCRLVSKEYRWLVPYDFIITIYEPNVIDFSEKALEILVYHELRHIGVNDTGREPHFYIVPHDIEDFEDILREHGIDWQVS